MALGPRLDLRQSQSLVMTPQLQQAIRLLALSNLEVESFIAEEIEKNPLLETGAGEPEGPAEPVDFADLPDAGEPRDEPTVDELVMTGDGMTDAPLDMDLNSEDFHQDSAADSAIGLDGGLGLTGGGTGSGGSSEEGADFDSFAGESRLAARSSPPPGGRVPVGRRPGHRRPDHRPDRRDRLVPRLPARHRPAPRRRAARGRAGARHDPDLRSGRHRRAQPRRMPRSAGEGRQPLRSGDGPADRQSRLSRQGQSPRSEAHLRRRRRGPGRHDPRAARLRSQAGLPLRRRRSGSTRSCPTCSSPAAAPAGRSS